MNRDLFLSILSMDSYNRSFNEGISSLSTLTFDENGNRKSDVKIGNAIIARDSSSLKRSDGLRLDVASNFYAIAYYIKDVSGFNDSDTVISFRGTDGVFDSNAFIIGGGNPYDPLITEVSDTVRLTIEFSREIIGNGGGNVITTGHSLGGGLAGYVAGLYGTEAAIFDNMTFNQAVERTYQDSVELPHQAAGELRSLIYG